MESIRIWNKNKKKKNVEDKAGFFFLQEECEGKQENGWKTEIEGRKELMVNRRETSAGEVSWISKELKCIRSDAVANLTMDLIWRYNK